MRWIAISTGSEDHALGQKTSVSRAHGVSLWTGFCLQTGADDAEQMVGKQDDL
jgi:hypothetical protein